MKKQKRMKFLKYIANKIFVPLTVLLLSSLTVANAQSAKGQVVDKIVAKVDNYIALKSELDLAHLDIMSRSQYGAKVDKCDVLRRIIQNKMMLAKAEIDSITVTNDEVSRELDRRIQYMVAQLGSEEEIEKYYKKPLSQFKAELRDKMKEQLIIGKVEDHITKDVEVTPAEVKKFFNNIPNDSLPFFSTEVMVGHIVKLPEISKDQKKQVEDQLNEIRQKILSGEVTFEEMAKKYSEDPGSAGQGGSLGFRKRGELVPEYEATALKMKPGDISKPVESQFGFHLIQLIERRGNTFNSRHILVKPGSSTLDVTAAERYLDSLRTQILENKISFEKAAKEYSNDKMTQSSGGYFTDQSGSSRISVDDIDPTIFFMIDTMKVGTISKPIPYRAEDGKQAVRIVYFKSKLAPHQANLKDDYQKIQIAALNEKKERMIQEWFEKAVEDVFIDVDDDYEYCNIAK